MCGYHLIVALNRFLIPNTPFFRAGEVVRRRRWTDAPHRLRKRAASDGGGGAAAKPIVPAVRGYLHKIRARRILCVTRPLLTINLGSTGKRHTHTTSSCSSHLYYHSSGGQLRNLLAENASQSYKISLNLNQ